jgi:hypothetical protein
MFVSLPAWVNVTPEVVPEMESLLWLDILGRFGCAGKGEGMFAPAFARPAKIADLHVRS